MRIGMVGLGKMGLNMTRRLTNAGHEVAAFDLNDDAIREAEASGAHGAASLDGLVARLDAPRHVWVMVPAGKPTDQVIQQLADLLSTGDAILDGGNSFYQDSMGRAKWLRDEGLHFVDVGTSGGVWGLAEGYSLMIGGEAAVVERLRPIFEALAPAPDQGWGHVGPAGAGHFVKMIHNGVEYGMMQAYAEGFAILDAKAAFDLDLHQVAEIWRHGSVVRSWLLDLAARALAENPSLDGLAPYVSDSGEGRWTVKEAVDLAVPAPVITEALYARFESRQDDAFAYKLLAALRHQFGGHAVKAEEP